MASISYGSLRKKPSERPRCSLLRADRSIRARFQRFRRSERPMSGLLPCWARLIAAARPHRWSAFCSCGIQFNVEQVAQPEQVVGDHVQAKYRTHVLSAAHFELAQSAPLLDLAEHLLDAAQGVDRLEVPLVACGALIDGGTTGAGGVLGHVRGDADAAHLGDKSLGVVVLVGTDGLMVGTGTICSHGFGGISFTGARGLRHLAIDNQGMPVIHQHMARVALLGRVSVGLAGQQGVGICAGAVGLVAELDATEVAFRSLLAVLGNTKAFTGA